MDLSQTRYAIGRFSNRLELEQALGELNRAGFLVAQISIVAKVADRNEPLDSSKISARTGAEAQEKAAIGAIAGGMLGAIFGWLASLGILMVPGVSLLVVVGTTGTALATIFAGAGIGAAGGGLILALATSEIPSKRATVARGSRWRDEFLVMVDGTDDEVHRARLILSRSSSSKVWVC